MKLFDITLPDLAICSDNSLYYRTSSDKIKRLEEKLLVPEKESVSFDTFFNCFSYNKYKKYTKLRMLGISLTLKGAFEINLYSVHANKPFDKILLSNDMFESEDISEVVIMQDIDNLFEEGYLFIELFSSKEDSVFYHGEYFAVDAKPESTKIALIFCTYKREDFLYKNVNNINLFLKSNEDLKDKFTIIIADNGNTIDKQKVDNASVFENKNLGGSGGFTRGIIETIKEEENTHFLLMDDDIVFDTKILRKTHSFIALASDVEKLALGGAMLELDRQYLQYEMGGKSTGLMLLNMKSGIDVRQRESLALNEREDSINYNAWWYMCMPVSAVRNGLPLPLFIKGDDVEYGLRFKGDIAVINGIAVWHESFDKKYGGELEYYIKRNELIITALYFPKVTIAQLMFKLIRAMGKRLVYQRYYEVDFIIKAYRDFLKGASFLLDTDATALHGELRNACPQFLDDQELSKTYDVTFDAQKFEAAQRDNRTLKAQFLTFNGYLIPKMFYKKEDKNSYKIVDVNNPHPINFYKSIKVLQYSTTLNKGFVTHLKRSKLLSSGMQILKIYILMLFRYKKACKSYKDNLDKLSSLEQWKKSLDI